MSLYGDLPPPSASQSIDSNGASTGVKPSSDSKVFVTTPAAVSGSQAALPIKQNLPSVAAPHFLPTAIRRPQASGSKFTMFRKPPVFKPTIAAGAPVSTPQPIVSYAPPTKTLSPPLALPPITVSLDEYDPKLPNDFAEMQRLRNESRVAALADSALNQGKRSRSSSVSSRSSSRTPPREVGRYAAIPPPAALNSPPENNNAILPNVGPSVSSGEEAYLRRLQLSQKLPPPTAPVASTSSKLTKDFSDSSILLLINMVGRGDVDITLESEVKHECSKFGSINKVLIHEVPPPFPDSQAVRIFVEFDSNISSSRAQSALDGRFFGGRAIQAKLFDPIKFHNLDLAPPSD